VFPTVPHVWQLIRAVPEARRSVRAAAAFLCDDGRATAAEAANASETVTVVPS
jgi:hypothetical protein